MMKAFREAVEIDIRLQRETIDRISIAGLEDIIRNSADQYLKKKFRSRVDGGGRKIEPIWITEEIRQGIKKRKMYNRLKRRGSVEHMNMFRELYKNQKVTVQQLIRKEKTIHERKITKEIKDAKDSNQKMWKMIDKLRGNVREERKIPLYSDGGEIEAEDREPVLMQEYWRIVYCGHENGIGDKRSEAQHAEYGQLVDMENRQRGTVTL